MPSKYLVPFFISMLPIIELRGALPVALAAGMPTIPAYIVCIVGNMLPVPFIFFFAQEVLEWGRDKKLTGKFFTKCIEKGEKAGKKLEADAGKGLYWALLLFVAIPLPGTGAWTGTLGASFMRMDWKRSILAVMGGVLLAGVIMGILTKLGIHVLS